MYYVYIIYSKKLKKFYTGFTNDLKRRIAEHKGGASNFTQQVDDWMLVYYEAFCDKKDAKTEEEFLKTGRGRERRKYLFKNFIENRE
ncbi:MAG: GIY-YIG nuclease superfamily protein [Candidatus Moranbacteria bacterium GW2011_GWF2_36_839]|nr:MAG: GIY-YIG nuclease superfamily protein [Candidatus Moranbacteria bacterium GW2011_GWF1_36_78]KKQ16863.1 MAG: GIY-YIG nuclease superfamily protein [Candidatus Moranbacteria bacterium GW2011_GWF2_36_839]HAT74387.1 excinuclease ABC subunit C [Candidatus Moranbacteria bacterium]HBY11139.1 excinuclease ABC subunit C [Candidatus Moranbacteria bacterium]